MPSPTSTILSDEQLLSALESRTSVLQPLCWWFWPLFLLVTHIIIRLQPTGWASFTSWKRVVEFHYPLIFACHLFSTGMRTGHWFVSLLGAPGYLFLWAYNSQCSGCCLDIAFYFTLLPALNIWMVLLMLALHLFGSVLLVLCVVLSVYLLIKSSVHVRGDQIQLVSFLLTGFSAFRITQVTHTFGGFFYFLFLFVIELILSSNLTNILHAVNGLFPTPSPPSPTRSFDEVDTRCENGVFRFTFIMPASSRTFHCVITDKDISVAYTFNFSPYVFEGMHRGWRYGNAPIETALHDDIIAAEVDLRSQSSELRVYRIFVNGVEQDIRFSGLPSAVRFSLADAPEGIQVVSLEQLAQPTPSITRCGFPPVIYNWAKSYSFSGCCDC